MYIYIYICKFFGLHIWRWHSAGTYDVNTKTGGPFGTIRHPDELAHEANNGLDIAVRLLEPIKQQFPILSYADFYQVIIIYIQLLTQKMICFMITFYGLLWIGELTMVCVLFCWSWLELLPLKLPEGLKYLSTLEDRWGLFICMFSKLELISCCKSSSVKHSCSFCTFPKWWCVFPK